MNVSFCFWKSDISLLAAFVPLRRNYPECCKKSRVQDRLSCLQISSRIILFDITMLHEPAIRICLFMTDHYTSRLLTYLITSSYFQISYLYSFRAFLIIPVYTQISWIENFLKIIKQSLKWIYKTVIVNHFIFHKLQTLLFKTKTIHYLCLTNNYIWVILKVAFKHFCR